MTSEGRTDLHTDAKYRQMTGEDDEVKGYELQRISLLRRSITKERKHVIRLIKSVHKSHSLKVRSRYLSEALLAAYDTEGIYTTIVTLNELPYGVLTPEQITSLRGRGEIQVKMTVTIDAESVFRLFTGEDPMVPTARTLFGPVARTRELLDLGIIKKVYWCDTRIRTDSGCTRGNINRNFLYKVMNGILNYKHETKNYKLVRRKGQ